VLRVDREKEICFNIHNLFILNDKNMEKKWTHEHGGLTNEEIKKIEKEPEIPGAKSYEPISFGSTENEKSTTDSDEEIDAAVDSLGSGVSNSDEEIDGAVASLGSHVGQKPPETSIEEANREIEKFESIVDRDVA
jgi:hypothetical protein